MFSLRSLDFYSACKLKTHPPLPGLVSLKLLLSASIPVQIFLAYRIRGLSQSWVLFIILASFSLAQGACGLTGGILATIHPE
jgi:hypothetical protein